MSSNAFGNIFKITTWGESHGKAVGVVIDGCPAGIEIIDDELQHELAMRAPGKNIYTTTRNEADHAQIYSGVFNGVTTGAPISIIIMNQDADSSKYESIKHLLRPGHANFTYLAKYGDIYDYKGGGRSSARETVCRVAAAYVAKKLLAQYSIQTLAYLSSVGDIEATDYNRLDLKNSILQSPIFCPDQNNAAQMMLKIKQAKDAGDSVGGVVTFLATGLPAGLGDPIYEKLEANLAKAMLSIPASKGFEIGDGFMAAKMLGSMHNDRFIQVDDQIKTQTNHAGGTLGGISTGMPLSGKVAFKPTSSIAQTQTTLDLEGRDARLTLPEGSRHDPCVAIRAVPVVDAMCALVLADALLMNRCVKIC